MAAPDPNQRVQSASVRTCNAHSRVTRAARKLTGELEEITATEGVPLADLDKEDSLVVVVERLIATASSK